MIAYKAFKKGLIATKGDGEYQYNEGWNEFPEAHCVKCGAHCAENPLDMFNYYHNINETEFRLVKAEGDIHENGSDSKIACTRLFVGKRLTIEEVAAHALNYMRRYPNRSKKTFDLKGYFHILRDKNPLLSGKKGEWLCFAVGDESFIEQIGMLYVAVGTIFPFVGSDVPETFMLCDGRKLDTNEYSELFSVIGYTFGGEGDVFNIPDLRGRTLVGRTVGVAGPLANIGNTGGADTVTIKDKNLPKHSYFGTESGLGVVRGKVQSSSDGRYTFLGKEAAADADSSGIKYIIGGGESLDNMPPYSTVDYIIKTMQGTAACEYDYARAINTAVKQNFDEAVAAGTIKGEKGESGVYVGTEEPTDPDVTVWVNPDGIADDIPSGGSDTDGVPVTHSWDGTVLTITSASGTSSAELKGEKGDTGAQGLQGENGYTPIRGVDYWTETDKEDINSNAESFIVDELAKRGQVKPEFANDISECTDTTKLYVLPNGYIHAYAKHMVVPYTNQIPLSVNSDGSEFVGENGEDGYISNYKLAMSTGDINVSSGVNTTGFIPVAKGDTLYFKNFNYKPGTDEESGALMMYKSDYTTIDSDNNGVLEGGILPQHINSYGYLVSYTVDESGYLKTLTIVDKYNYGVGSIRFSGRKLNANTIITINEEIVDGVYEYAWVNTGRAFVPADYEDRILNLEESKVNHEERIKSLELYGADSTSTEDIPAYIKAEANAVISRLMAKQGNRSFTFIGMSDFHYQNFDSDNGKTPNRLNLISACKAISYIQGRIHIDAVATLGDNVPFGVTDTTALRYKDKWFQEINEILKMTEKEGITIFRTPGNHDRMGANDENGNPTEFVPDNAIFSYITGYNARSCILGDVPGGWAYKDFVGHKLRVIVLNTDECEGKSRFSEHGYHISNKQYKWLIDTLDLSDKQDATEWQILLLSHHRADDSQTGSDATSPWFNNGCILPNILNAYKTGSSYSAEVAEEGISVSCNFEGIDRATIIGQIHGHHHDYRYFNLYLGLDQDVSTQTEIMAIGTPTSSFITNGNIDNDGNTYTSVRDTASETAFCIYSIDLDNHKIHAIHYGNGIDREIDY